MRKDSSGYDQKKAKLISELRVSNGQTLALNKSGSNLFRPRNADRSEKKIDVKSFNKVISIDKDNLIAEVEGMATYEDIVNETLKYGCLPTVAPELKSITIGGALSGCGIESSSFRYGLVHETILEAEVLLSDGSIVVCTPDNAFSDLFHALPNTFGTLGYVLKVKVKLIPAKKFVKLKHLRYSDPARFFQDMERYCLENRQKSDYAYIDGVIFNESEMYITLGQFVDEVPYLSDYTYAHIYYKSIQSKAEDYLTSLDYIWRWDPDWFWCSKVFFMQNKIPRLLFGKWMLKSKVYARIMHFFGRHPMLGSMVDKIQGRTESIIQDILIPAENALAFYDFFRKEIGIKPVWICPTFPSDRDYTFCHFKPGTLYFDFGFWDMIPSEQEQGFYNRKIEKVVTDLAGFKSLYSSSYYTPEEFWALYDRNAYRSLKQKYDGSGRLKGLYEKCVLATDKRR